MPKVYETHLRQALCTFNDLMRAGIRAGLHVGKEYRKLTAEQFAEFMRHLFGVFAVLRCVNERIASAPPQFDSIMLGDYEDYSWIHEFSLSTGPLFLFPSIVTRPSTKWLPPDLQEALLNLLRNQDQMPVT